MTAQLFNNVSDVLLNPVDTADTEIQIQSGNVPSISPGDYTPIYVIRANGSFEIMHVTAVSGTTLTVLRAQEGTDPLVFESGASVQIRPTRQSLLEMGISVEDAEVTTSTGTQTLAGALDDRALLSSFNALDADYGDTKASYLDLLDAFGFELDLDSSGATDISSVLQAALDTFGVVSLPSGDFKLSAQITLKSGNRIIGQGGGATRIFRDTAVANFDFFEGAGVDDVVISGIHFDAVAKLPVTDGANRRSALRFWNGGSTLTNSRIRVTDCRFSKFTNAEVQPEGTRGVITLEDCSHVWIQRNYFDDNRATCIYWVGTTSQVFVGWNRCLGEQLPYDTLFQPEQGLGSFTSGVAGGVTVANNRIKQTGYTSLNVSGVGVTVTANYIESPSYSGITVNELEGVTARVTITGNVIGDPGLDGVSLFNVEDCVVSGNMITGAQTLSRAGIQLYPTTGGSIPTSVHITGNLLRANAAGIRIRAGVNITSSGNIFSGNVVGIILRNENVLLSRMYSNGDTFRNNTSYAMILQSDAPQPQRVDITNAMVFSADLAVAQSRGLISQGANSTMFVGNLTFSPNYNITLVRADFSTTGYGLYALDGGTVSSLGVLNGTP